MTQLNYERIYQYRFQGINPEKKNAAWGEISRWIYEKMGRPNTVLDPAAGSMEFLNNIGAREKWAVDLQKPDASLLPNDVRFVQGNIFDVQLPENYFEGIFISNFLEHLHSVEEISTLLTKLHKSLKKEGVIAIMGPNFKYCSKVYFDCADHRLALSHIAIEEHLFAAGFEIKKSHAKFLPYSFRSKLPAASGLVKLYLNMPLSWGLLGKQFLIFAKKAT